MGFFLLKLQITAHNNEIIVGHVPRNASDTQPFISKPQSIPPRGNEGTSYLRFNKKSGMVMNTPYLTQTKPLKQTLRLFNHRNETQPFFDRV